LNNHIIEHQFIRTSGTISNNRVIELDKEIIGESIINTTLVRQQSHTDQINLITGHEEATASFRC